MKKYPFILLLAVACGGSDNQNDNGGGNNPVIFDTSAMLGTWTGVATLTANGQAATGTVSLHITTAGNDMSISGICDAGIGVPATGTSKVTFTISKISCPPVSATGGCPSVTMTLTSGTGNEESGHLTISAIGALAGCSQSFPLTLSFNGVQQ
jgi:hypothetical protein